MTDTIDRTPDIDPERPETELSDSPTPRPMAKAIKGFGAAYLRNRTWWIRYQHLGHEIRESSKSEDRRVAERLLKKRWRAIMGNRFLGPKEEKTLVNDLLDALQADYQQNHRRSTATLRWRLDPLRVAFGTARVVDVGAAAIGQYKADRLATTTRTGRTVAVATLNRELACLRRAFQLGIEQERVAHAPVIKLLHEDNARQGFVEPRVFETIAAHLPAPLDDAARFAYTSGWRKNEIFTLGWADVDLDHRRVTLRAEHSKNGETRVLVLTGALLALMERRWAARSYETQTGTALSTFVFHRRGQRLVDIRTPWATACAKAGVPGLLLHDLRRSAVRNMMKSGQVDQAVAMKISGHKTDSVFRRYRIVDEDDIEQALVATEASVTQAPASNVTSIGTGRRRS
jgi:integrase